MQRSYYLPAPYANHRGEIDESEFLKKAFKGVVKAAVTVGTAPIKAITAPARAAVGLAASIIKPKPSAAELAAAQAANQPVYYDEAPGEQDVYNPGGPASGATVRTGANGGAPAPGSASILSNPLVLAGGGIGLVVLVLVVILIIKKA